MHPTQDDLYREASEAFGAALDRLVQAYELDFDKRKDLLQEIHLALWRSFARFEERCSLRTWVYRIAHNTATSHVIRQRRANAKILMSIEDVESMAGPGDAAQEADNRIALERLLQLIHRLKPLDREVMLLYLEGLDAAAIGEITGISPGNARTQIYRIKAILARRFHSAPSGVKTP